jgi:hypothetical protein
VGAGIINALAAIGINESDKAFEGPYFQSHNADRRSRVEAAIAELGYVRNATSGQPAAHWRRSGFASWLLYPATTGSYPARAPYDAHPVPLLAEPWPGIPARGKGAANRAEACWVPIAPGLTPHGLRHTHRTIMEEAGTPPKLMDERLGHEDGSVQARYSHVTPRMRARLMDALTEQREEAVEARRRMSRAHPSRRSTRSSEPGRDQVGRRKKRSPDQDLLPIFSQGPPQTP